MNNQIDIIGVLENRNSKLKVNHRIGSRDIANQELKEISTCIGNLIPHIREAVEKAKKYDDLYEEEKQMSKYQEALDNIVKESCPIAIKSKKSCNECRIKNTCNCKAKDWINTLQELVNQNINS